MSRSWQIPMSENRKFRVFGKVRPQADKIRLLKPLTYMNRSGQAIRAVTDWFKLPHSRCWFMTICLRLGRFAYAYLVQLGGHNGMKARSHTLATKFSRESAADPKVQAVSVRWGDFLQPKPS